MAPENRSSARIEEVAPIQPDQFGGPRVEEATPGQPDQFGGPRIEQKPSIDCGTLKKGKSLLKQVTILNPNTTVALAWKASIQYGTTATGWITLGQISSPIAANKSVLLDVTVVTSQLSSGHTYTAKLFANSQYGDDSTSISVTVS